MGYKKIQVPAVGDKITVNADHSLNVPNNPIIPYIEGDGIGVDISPVMIKVVDAAVEKAYGGKRKISWMEVYAGEKATQVYGHPSQLEVAVLLWRFFTYAKSSHRQSPTTRPVSRPPSSAQSHTSRFWPRSRRWCP